MERISNYIFLPWAAWHGDEILDLPVPSEWRVHTYPMEGGLGLDADELQYAFENPIGSESISRLARGKKSVAIAIDDLSRPTPSGQILEYILQELDEASVPPDAITIIISLGAHTPLQRPQLTLKLGQDIVDNFRIVNHDCRQNLAPTGAFLGKSEVLLNKDFYDAEFRILVGSVVPHHFAGFSGGAKMILPGLSNLDAIAWTHRAVLMGLRGHAGTLENNRFRSEFERVAAHVGVDITVNAVVNGRREIAGLFVGDMIQAHRAAAEFARRVYATQRPQNLDIAVLNCYPKDTELIQAENAFMYLHTAGVEILRADGTVVITSACSEGLGRHALFEPGGVLYRTPGKKAFLQERRLAFFSPQMDAETFHQTYWEGYDFFDSWLKLVASLRQHHGDACNVGVFPHASLQIVSDEG